MMKSSSADLLADVPASASTNPTTRAHAPYVTLEFSESAVDSAAASG
jgi:hypothetical protein